MTGQSPISGVPTNIITGFLGSGKTTAILHLLKAKPANERWAILVNEFGEIGIDGSLFESQHTEKQGVFIKEVPGGCMCCTAGLPMQVALNTLLSKARPDRLLIEPTGLGHPIEVLESLSSDPFKAVLNIQKIITLVDARNLSDERYTRNEIFNQQISIADIIVGNKSDLYEQGDLVNLEHYAKTQGSEKSKLLTTEHGQLDIEVVGGKTESEPHAHHDHDHHQHDHDHLHSHDHEHHNDHEQTVSVTEAPIPEAGYLKVKNSGEEFHSIGWRFAQDVSFKSDAIEDFLSGLSAERAKAVVCTDAGPLGYNLTSDGLSKTLLNECSEGRVEIIADMIKDDWETALLACRQLAAV